MIFNSPLTDNGGARMLTRCAFILGLIFSSAAVHAEDATAVFARFKSASGGARWDMVRTVRATGGLSAGGLSGVLRTTTDVQAGRSSAQYTLGPIEGANGYDGQVAWTRAPGGEVAVQDGPEARREARRQVWLDTLAYWYPDRLGAL